MKDIYVNRLAILDKEDKTSFYEISTSSGYQFFSDKKSDTEGTFKGISDIVSETYLNSLSYNCPIILTIPIEALSINKILTLPKALVYIQINLPKKIKVNTIKKLHFLREKGYTVVLNYFKRKSKLAFHLMACCDIIKIDKHDFVDEEFIIVNKFFKKENKKVMAINVNSQKERGKLINYGINFFSGNYFCKPTVITNKKLGAFKPNSLQLLKIITKTPIDYDELANLISRDIIFTYKIIKYVNSAFFIKQKNISDVKQAIAYLGEREIKKWAFVILSSSLGEDKPDELMIKALTKARFCEQIADELSGVNSNNAFMMGIFSYMSVLANISFEDFAEEIAMDTEIYSAIKTFDGVLGKIFEISNIYESCKWDKLSEVIEQDVFKNLQLSKFYFNTINWVNEIMKPD